MIYLDFNSKIGWQWGAINLLPTYTIFGLYLACISWQLSLVQLCVFEISQEEYQFPHVSRPLPQPAETRGPALQATYEGVEGGCNK